MPKPRVVVIISADGEWDVIHRIYPQVVYYGSPYGEWFTTNVNNEQIIFLNGGWGKVPSAASCQYAIDRWSPKLVINFGTCGGFQGYVKRFDIILAEKTIIYDVYSQMSDPEATIERTITNIELGWLKDAIPFPVKRGTIVSGDRDIHPEDVDILTENYGALGGDWESGSIAYVCHRNEVRFLILRGVSDIVSSKGGEAYKGNKKVWYQATDIIIRKLIEYIPELIALSLDE